MVCAMRIVLVVSWGSHDGYEVQLLLIFTLYPFNLPCVVYVANCVGTQSATWLNSSCRIQLVELAELAPVPFWKSSTRISTMPRRLFHTFRS
jgi:hypothetical protein